jgi:polysaccharide chain length determinant protein (PEP-CTERM system associated)
MPRSRGCARPPPDDHPAATSSLRASAISTVRRIAYLESNGQSLALRPDGDFRRAARLVLSGRRGTINPHVHQALNEIQGAWRFRWMAIAAATVVATAGWLIVFALPDWYGATAEVLVNTRTALTPALKDLAVEPDVTVQLNYVRESLRAGPQLRRIAQLTGMLAAAGVDPARQEEVLSGLRKRIQLTVQKSSEAGSSAGTSYGLFYEDTRRARALKVVNILLNTLVDETLGGKRQGAQNAQQFLESEIRDDEKHLRAAEDRLAAFKSSHLGQMPSEQGGYFAQLQKETGSVEDLRTKLLTAQSRRDALESQLHGNAAVSAVAPMPIAGAAGITVGVDTASRIAETQASLDKLLLQFTDKHPDVIAARAVLAKLKERRAVEIESLRRGDANAVAASGASASPVYQSIQLLLNQAVVDIADLHMQLSQHQAKVQELRRFLNTAPQVEAEYAQLTRDYDVNKAHHAALLSNYQKARLGERADNAGSVRFEIVQPPTVSYRPVSPRRGMLLAGILLAALAAGGALAYKLDRLRPVVSSAEGLVKLTGVKIVGIVGQAYPTSARRAFRRELWQISIAVACLVIVFAVELSISWAGLRLSLPALNHMVRAWVS